MFFEGKINLQKEHTHIKTTDDNKGNNDHDISQCLKSHIFHIYRKTRFLATKMLSFFH